MQSTKTALIRVWDPLVRIGHWSVVAGFFVAYFTEDDLLRLHAWAGYLVGAVVALRIVWGFVGTRHARFADFIYRPRTVISYARDLFAFRARRYLGHSPAGGAVIVAVLVMLAATVYSGLVAYALEENRGPLAPYVWQTPAQAVPAAAADDKGDDDLGDDNGDKATGGEARSESWKELHEALSDATLILILFHIGGVAWASYAHRENLVRSMITGDKRPNAED
ncbi:MAG TPA: cytochrome b/b6 domain-containing protein [Kiloniellales bacterium]